MVPTLARLLSGRACMPPAMTLLPNANIILLDRYAAATSKGLTSHLRTAWEENMLTAPRQAEDECDVSLAHCYYSR